MTKISYKKMMSVQLNFLLFVLLSGDCTFSFKTHIFHLVYINKLCSRVLAWVGEFARRVVSSA